MYEKRVSDPQLVVSLKADEEAKMEKEYIKHLKDNKHPLAFGFKPQGSKSKSMNLLGTPEVFGTIGTHQKDFYERDYHRWKKSSKSTSTLSNVERNSKSLSLLTMAAPSTKQPTYSALLITKDKIFRDNIQFVDHLSSRIRSLKVREEQERSSE